MRNESIETPKDRYGYVIVLVAFLVMVIAWGANYSFGVFFTPLLREFGWTRAITSGPFSVAILLEGFGGMFMGRICDRFGPRSVVTVCGVFFGTGYILMPRVSAPWHLYLTYGLLVGIGLSGTYVPLSSTVAHWFKKRRGLMVGIVSSGIGAGTLIISPLANNLISRYGWRFSCLLIGVMALILMVVFAQLLRFPHSDLNRKGMRAVEPQVHGKHGSMSQAHVREALRDGHFWMLCTILLCWGTTVFVILVHIAPYVVELGYSAAQGAEILALFGGTVFFAKIIVGIAADRIGSRHTFVTGLVCMTAGLLLLLVSHSSWSLYLFAVIYAFGYGCGSVMMPVIVAEMFGLLSHGILLGVVNFSACIGCAIGPVTAGWLFDRSGTYHEVFVLTTILSIITLAMGFFIRRKSPVGCVTTS
jgi:MFS family permease